MFFFSEVGKICVPFLKGVRKMRKSSSEGEGLTAGNTCGIEALRVRVCACVCARRCPRVHAGASVWVAGESREQRLTGWC